MADESVWMYSPSFALAIVGSVVYGLIFLAITYITIVKYRLWYFSVIVIGAAIEVGGYIARAYSTKNQTEIAPFVVTLVLIVLAPVFVAAANYMLISRLIIAVLPSPNHRILGIPGHRLTPIFVTFDVVAFLVQGNGSGVASSNNWTGKEERIGTYILIAGLSTQLAAFSFFLAVLSRFHWLATRHALPEAPVGWKKIVVAVYVSSILIMVRCIFRVVEFSEGMDGYAFRNEWLFWVFEALPMTGAIAVFCLYHPGRHLGKISMPPSGLLCCFGRSQRRRKTESSDEGNELRDELPT